MQTVLVYNGLYDNYMVDDYVEDDSAIYFTAQIDNYVDGSGLLDLVVDYQQGYGLTDSNGDITTYSNWSISLTGRAGTDADIFKGGTLSNTLQWNGNSNDFLALGFDNYLVTSDVYDVVSDFISLDSTDVMQILSDNDLTVNSGTQITLSTENSVVTIGTSSIQILSDDLEINSGTISLIGESGIVLVGQSGIVTTSNNQGLVYTDDYSSGFVTHSLVDKAYVDNSGVVVSGLLNSIQIAGVDNSLNDFGLITTDSIYLNKKILATPSGCYNTFLGQNSGYNNLNDDNVFVGFCSGYQNTSGCDNVFIGSGSGQSNTTGEDNTFLGAFSGQNNTTGSYNVFIGASSGESNTTGVCNVFIGYGSGGFNTSGLCNTFVGVLSGRSNTIGCSNTFIGSSTGFNNTSGYSNIFIGSSSGYNNTIGSSNIFIGESSGLCNTTGGSNTFIGKFSGRGNITGYSNTFIGNSSGFNSNANNNTFVGESSGLSNTTGTSNTFMGSLSGYSNTSGYSNIFIGYLSGFSNTTGYNNTFVGYYSGYGNKANNNTFVGQYSGFSNTTGTDNTFIGAGSGYCNDGGIYNLFIGSYAGYDNTSGVSNTFVGFASGYNNKTGGFNTFIGISSGYNNDGGLYNTFLGKDSGYLNTTGSQNTFLGFCSGKDVTTGQCNTIVGSLAGGELSTGSYNTIVGANVLIGSSSNNNIILSDGQGNIKYQFDGTTNNINGGLVVSGHTVLAEVSEVVTTSFGATSSTVVYNFNDGLIWYHDSANTNYTANFINMPITNDRVITANILINQGVTGYAPTTVQIGGVTQTVKWSNGTYSVSTNAVDIIGFTFIRSGSSWTQVLGQINTFS